MTRAPDEPASPAAAAFQAKHGIDGRPGHDGDRERWCDCCESRVTVGNDGETEYGHKVRCPHRPDDFPKGSRGTHYYDPSEGSA